VIQRGRVVWRRMVRLVEGDTRPRRGVASRHGGSILFLAKALLCAFLIIWLAQYLSSSPVCSIPTSVDTLPDPIQQVLLTPEEGVTWRCPYDPDSTVSFSFQLISDSNETSSNVTLVKVLKSEIDTVTHKDTPATFNPGGVSVHSICGSLVLTSCDCLAKVLELQECYIHSQEVISKPLLPTHALHHVFFLYFILSIILLFVALILYLLCRVTTDFLKNGRTRTGSSGPV